MSAKINALAVPALKHFAAPFALPETRFMLLQEATKEVAAKVMIAVNVDENGTYWVVPAVYYGEGSRWYLKEKKMAMSKKDALKIAYGLLRKHFAVTASRCLAGLLHDSVVPATDDIDC